MINASKVLIIDDSTTTCQHIERALREAGYDVSIANDGREGLMKIASERPQCLILDVVLPGMSGYDICRQLRARDAFRHLPIIMISIKNTPTDQAWALRQGANRYLPKPFSEETLVQTVREFLPTPAPAPGPPRPMPNITRQFNTFRSTKSFPLGKLVPHPIDEAGKVNPHIVHSLDPADLLAHQLYAIIDGERDIDRLCAITKLKPDELSKVLRMLLTQQRILLFDPEGKIVDDLSFLTD